MGYKEELLNVFTYWQTCMPIVANAFILYFLIYILGAIALFSFSKKLIASGAINVLLAKLLSGIILFTIIVSCYYTYFKTIQVCLFVPFIYLCHSYFNQQYLTISNFKKYIRIDAKYFFVSLLILPFILFLQFWKFDFFNPSQISVWCDYAYYSGISKKMCLEHIEGSFYSIPFSNVHIPYNFYHYSDVWISAGFEKLAVGVNGVNIYAYLYFTIASTILLVAFSSVIITSSAKKNSSYFVFFAMVILLFSNEIFHHFSHRLFISFAILIAFYKVYNANNLSQSIAILMLIPILNPLFIIIIPFIVLFIFIDKFSSHLNATNILISSIFLVCIATFYFLKLASCNTLIEIFNSMLHDELQEPNFIKLKYLITFFIVYKTFFHWKFSFKRQEIIVLLIAVFFIVMYYFFNFSLLINSSENFQLAWLLKRTSYFIIAIVLSKKLLNLFADYAHQKKHLIFAFFLFGVAVFHCMFNLNRYFVYSKDYNYYFNKKALTELEKALTAENSVIGYYKIYDTENTHNQYTYQRASTSEFLSMLESFKQKKAWLTPVFVHNKFNQLIPEVKNNWRKTEFYNFKQKCRNDGEAQVFESFIKKYQIKIILTDVAETQLPFYIKSKIKNVQKFTIQTNQFSMLVLR
jgi:hypothetical protein